MNTSYKLLPQSRIEILFELSPEEFKEYFEEAIEILGQDFETEGFRKGRVPREILEKKLPSEKILEEAVDHAVKHSYVAKIKELAVSETEKIEVIGRPEIEIIKFAKGSPLEFKATASIMPSVVLSDYKKIAVGVKLREVAVEEKEVEESLKFLQKSKSQAIPKAETEPCEKGDFVDLTFCAPEIENNKEQADHFVLGEGQFIPGFEEVILGMKLKEEKEFALTFPEKYFKEELSGKEVHFKVKVNAISRIEIPEMTDEWAKSFGEFKNLEALRESVREGMGVEKAEEAKQAKRAEILEKILEASHFEVPEILVEAEQERMMQELKANLQNQFKISFSDYLERVKKTEKEIFNSFSTEAGKRAKSFLILREIAQKENISVSDQELEEKVNEFLRQHPDITKTEKEIDLNRVKEYYKETITNEKVFQLLENN